MNIFSENLKKLREGRSQKEFAEFLGISSQQTYANYEKGRIPKNNTLQQIAQRCDVSIDWLLGKESASNTLNYLDKKDYKGAFEAFVKTMPLQEIYKKIHSLLDEAQDGNDDALLAAREAFELIFNQKNERKK